MSGADDAPRRLLLHLGPHKTGSTAIQRHCASIRDALARGGCCYPHAGCWGDQHLLLPASLLPRHAFVPSELLGQGPEPVLAALAAEVPPRHTTLLSSEVFWELLMNQPRKAEALFTRLTERYDLTVLWIDRPEEDRLWSSIQHIARTGLAMDAAERLALMRERNRAAAERLAALGCATVRLPFPTDGGDVVETFLAALPPGDDPTAIGALVEQRRASAAGSRRDNAAPAQPRAAAFCVEFARRLQGRPHREAVPLATLGTLLDQAIHHPLAPAAWQDLPAEAELRRRLLAAEGRTGTLLSPAEAMAWEGALEQGWLTELAAGLGCAGILEAMRRTSG